jgi:hypothetical protein
MLPERIASKSKQCNLVIEAVCSIYPSKRIDIPNSTTNIYWVIIIRFLASDVFEHGRTDEKLDWNMFCDAFRWRKSKVKYRWVNSIGHVQNVRWLFCKYFRMLFLRSLEAGSTVWGVSGDYCLRTSFILWPVIQVRRLFQSNPSTQCDLVFPFQFRVPSLFLKTIQ